MPSAIRYLLNFAFVATLSAVLGLLTGCEGTMTTPHGAVVDVNKYNFRSVVIKNQRPVLVEFWSHSCEPCKELEPRLAALAKEHQELVVAKINSEESDEIAQEYGVHLVPTLFVFQEGDVVGRHIGLATPRELTEFIAPYVRSQK